MTQLKQIIEKLKNNDKVDCVFFFGSRGKKDHKLHSDIDLAVILKRNEKDIKSVYTFIDGTFAEIFFFDLSDIKKLKKGGEINPRVSFGVLTTWLQNADIQFDKSGTVSSFIRQRNNIFLKVPYSDAYKQWETSNYNYFSNKRYFDSNDPLYHEALEIRLFYCVAELITDYFLLRNIPWRGEKNAILWFKKNDPGYYKIFKAYIQASDLKERFNLYSKMFHRVFPNEYKIWNKNSLIVRSYKEFTEDTLKGLTKYWKNLIR